VINEKEESASIINHLEEEKIKLQDELNAKKQQIEDQL
jgi:hypothetical protein